MRNANRYDHDVSRDIFLRGITLDSTAHTWPADRFHRLAVGIVLRRVFELSTDQERTGSPDDVIEFGNVVVRPPIQGSVRRPCFEMEKISAEVELLCNIDHARRMISVRFHQSFEICMGNESKRLRFFTLSLCRHGKRQDQDPKTNSHIEISF